MEFYISDYVRQNYLPDFGPIRFTHLKEDMEIPYGTITFARKDADGQYVSYLVADEKKPWEETIAKKLLDDSRAGVVSRSVMVDKTGNGNYEDATAYRLTVYNHKCCLFLPSIHEAVSGAVNTKYKFEMELLFNLGDDLLLPVRKTCEGEGAFSLNFAEHLYDQLRDLDAGDAAESLEAFFEDVPNASFDNENNVWQVVASGPESGIQEVEFCVDTRTDASMALRDLVQGLCSVRIISFEEVIVESPKE